MMQSNSHIIVAANRFTGLLNLQRSFDKPAISRWQ